MRITLVGSRHFGVTTLNMLRQQGVDVARVVVADGEDRLAAAARDAGIAVVVQANPRLVVASEIAPDTDLIIAAHSHARVGKDALAAAMTLYPNRTFDAEKDFVTIGLINNAASTWAARATLPPKSFAELVSASIGVPGLSLPENIPPGLEPNCGSVRPKQPSALPLCSSGSHLSFCSADPYV